MRKEIFIVKEVEATLDEGRLKDLDLDVNLYCYETFDEAKQCMEDLFKEKVEKEFDIEYDDEEDRERLNELSDEGYMEYGLEEEKAYIHSWDEFSMGRNWDLTIVKEYMDVKEEK